jgi:hypothetical protein
MARQPTLAEILADDTGKIRREVADLLMEPAPARPQVAPRPDAQRRPLSRAWLAFIAVVFIIILGLAFLPDQDSRVQTSELVRIYRGNAVENYSPRIEKKENRPPIKKGRVIGDNVNVRGEPSLQGQIIQKVHQGQVLEVLSFVDGWYRILLEDQRPGYIFGAYLLPLDFESCPYLIGMTKSQTKVLLKEVNHPIYYQVILPNGQKGMIRKDNVALIQ